MSETEFRRRLAEACPSHGIDEGCDSSLLLAEDLGMDSLDIFEITMAIEELAEFAAGRAAIDYPMLRTCADLFSYYQILHDWASDKEMSATNPRREQRSTS